MRWTVVKNTLLSTLFSLLVLLFLEGMMRVGHTVRRDFTKHSASHQWYIYSPELGWERRPDFRGPGTRGLYREFDSQGLRSLDTPQIADSTKPRIVFLGDSNTHGVSVGSDSTFVELLDSRLPEANAINLGVPGYTSFQGYQTLLMHGPDLRPDVIVASFNFNDRRYVWEEDGSARFLHVYETDKANELRRELDHIYLARGMSFLLGLAGWVDNSEHPMEPVGLGELRPRVDPETYRQNLVKIIEWAKDHGSSVIFLLLKDNPIQTRHLGKGIRNLEDARYELAIANLRIAMRQKWFEALARIYLEETYRKTGATQEAQEIMVDRNPIASLHGALPIHLDSEYNRIMRSVANTNGVAIVDAGRELDLTPNVYVDVCHFDEGGHARIALLLLDPVLKAISESVTTHQNPNSD